MLWLFIGIINTSEILDFACVHELIESLDIALTADIDGTLDINLDKIADFSTCPFACFAVRGNGGRDTNHPIAGQQVTDKSDALDVGIAILAAETEALTQMGAHNISVQHLNVTPDFFQSLLNAFSQGAFACTGQSCKPECKSCMCHCALSSLNHFPGSSIEA